LLISGATLDSCTLPSAELSDSGTYTVKVSNMVNTVTSVGARVVVAECAVDCDAAVFADGELLAHWPRFSVVASGTAFP
jgi:hypothetical protein